MTTAMLDAMPIIIEETIDSRPGEQSLLQENAFLRSIIVELLIKNQKLRCAAQRYSYQVAGS